jgi:hypothetical protein
MSDDLILTDRVAEAGDVIETEDVYELTAQALAYLAEAPVAFAPEATGSAQ